MSLFLLDFITLYQAMAILKTTLFDCGGSCCILILIIPNGWEHGIVLYHIQRTQAFCPIAEYHYPLFQVELIWTQMTEKCLQGKAALNDALKLWIDFVGQLAQFAKEMVTSLTYHSVLTSLLTLDVHRRDVLQFLVTNNVTSPKDFHWLRFLLANV